MGEIFGLFSLKDLLLALLICNVRLMAFCQISIFFSTQYLTGLGRNASILSLALILFPMVYPSALQHAYGDFLPCLGYMLKEVFLGTVMGFLSNFMFYVAQGAGFLIDTQRGASMASIFDPLTNSQTSPLGEFLLKFALVLALTSGAFLLLLEAFYQSYQQWPIFAPLPTFNVFWRDFFLKTMGDGLLQEMVGLCGPVLFILFLAEFGLGMVTRFAPQLNVFFLAMPIKSALAMFFVILYLTFLIDYFKIKFVSCDLIAPFLEGLKRVLQ